MKILQRVYKYGGQPFVNDILYTRYGTTFEDSFGKKNGKALLSATSGRYEYTIFNVSSVCFADCRL